MGRIVVNFEPGKAPAAARAKRRRWPRLLAVFALFVVVVVVLAVAGVFFWWRHYQSTPVYSLALLIDAAQRGNTEEMAARLDDDEIVRNMVGRVSQKATERYGFAMTPAAKQQIDQVVSSASPTLKQAIHDEVANEVKALAPPGSGPQSFVFLLLAIPSLVKITTEGEIARAAAAINNQPFEIMMRRDGDRWRVVGFNDDRLVHAVVDSMMKELPPIGPVDSNNPLFKNPGTSRKKRR